MNILRLNQVNFQLLFLVLCLVVFSCPAVAKGLKAKDSIEDACIAERPSKTNPLSEVEVSQFDHFAYDLDRADGIAALKQIKKSMVTHGHLAWAQADHEYRVNKIKVKKPAGFKSTDPFEVQEPAKLKLDYHVMDSNLLIPQKELFKNQLPSAPGLYTYVFTADGQMTIGKVMNKLEFGVKHHQLAQGRKAFAAGELKVEQDPETKKMIFQFNDQSGTFSKPIVQYLNSSSEDSAHSAKFIKNPEKYTEDLRGFMQKHFTSLVDGSEGASVSYTKERLCDQLPHPTVEYLKDLCSRTDFRMRNMPTVGAKIKNLPFCLHVDQLDSRKDYATDPHMLYGVDPI